MVWEFAFLRSSHKLQCLDHLGGQEQELTPWEYNKISRPIPCAVSLGNWEISQTKKSLHEFKEPRLWSGTMIDKALREITNEDPNCQVLHGLLLFLFSLSKSLTCIWYCQLGKTIYNYELSTWQTDPNDVTYSSLPGNSCQSRPLLILAFNYQKVSKAKLD